ncbi:CD226 antigen isoform X1 [Thalassophryne amazonica]|uniref:CD226 antigen isoform X1 n=1 Tax=Thalassophryne amazonica TaxID=390379 RepID=UPI001470BF1C|nr:CD226 antigen isoform X1 [Thalassophryne amazonica]
MEAVQKDHWYLVVLILLLFLKVSVPQKDAVSTVHLEEGMVLSCLCPWTGNLSMVSWTKVPDKNPLAVFHPEYGVALSHHYYERVEFLRTTPMDGSISMRNVTHQDIGIYQCSVQTFPRGSWTRTIQVEDLDEPPEEETTDLPSDDVIEMDAEQNNNLTISCNHEHNGTVYQVIVEKMPHGQPWTIIGVCKVVDGDLVVEDYSDRGRVSCAHSLDVSLQLTDVVEEDKGFYRCSFSTDAGMQTTTVLLTVPTPGRRTGEWSTESNCTRITYRDGGSGTGSNGYASCCARTNKDEVEINKGTECLGIGFLPSLFGLAVCSKLKLQFCFAIIPLVPYAT